MPERELVWIWNGSEIPALRSGHRVVQVEIGRKWVRVWKDAHGTGNALKVPRYSFDRVYLGPAQ